MLLVRELTVIGEVAPDADCVVPPSLDVHVAVKPVIALPPALLAVNETVAELFPDVVADSDGADGALAATKELDADDAGLLAIELVAMTLQV